MTENTVQHGSFKLGAGEMWALSAAFSYALTNVFARVAVRGNINYLLGVILRATPVCLFSLVMVLSVRRRNPQAVSPFSDWKLIGVLVSYGVLTFVVGGPLLFYALQVGGVLVTTPVTGTQVLWSGLLAAVFLHERLNWKMVVGMLICAGGIALLALGQSGGVPVSPRWWLAIPLALGTAFCWSLSGVLVAYAMRRGVDHFQSLAVATSSGILLLNIYLLAHGQISVYWQTPLSVEASVLLAGMFGAVALISVTTAISLTTIASANAINSLQVVIAPLIAWIFLGEQLNLTMSLGILAVMSGVVCVQWAKGETDRQAR
ncbi:MAG: DMT family transporter [Chloroflexota bacterium]|nr:DMT family transporter [Chloroflexota bacterium]